MVAVACQSPRLMLEISYAAALRKLGFSFSLTTLDSLVDRLDAAARATGQSMPQSVAQSTSAPVDGQPLSGAFPHPNATFHLPESNDLAMSQLYTPTQTYTADPFLDLWPW
jgi:hypothetical protein